MLERKELKAAPRNKFAELPQVLQPRNTAEKHNENVLCFLGSHGVFSNLDKTPFLNDDTQYSCTKQYIQWSKAQLFEDDLVHHRTMEETDQYKSK